MSKFDEMERVSRICAERASDMVFVTPSHLEDAQLAALSTYIRQSWTNDADPIRVSEVAAVRRLASHRPAHWTQ